MKINITHNKLTKSLLLASAAMALSLSSAHAANYIVSENNTQIFSDITDLSGGNISVGNDASIWLRDSTFGTDSSRFTVSVGSRPTAYASIATFDMNATTIYADYVNLDTESIPAIQLANGSNLFVANDIGNYVHNCYMYISDYSKIIAPKISVDAITMWDSYGSFEGHITQLNLYSSTWRTPVGSYIDELYMQSSTVDFVINSATDKVTFYDVCIEEDNNYFNFSFSESFIESIVNGAGYYQFQAYDTIVLSAGNFGDGSYEYAVSDSNEKYSWTVTYDIDYCVGLYRIDNIVAIPEPSTYATIFGAVALGLAIYRRRK